MAPHIAEMIARLSKHSPALARALRVMDEQSGRDATVFQRKAAANFDRLLREAKPVEQDGNVIGVETRS